MQYELLALEIESPNDNIIDMATCVRIVALEDCSVITQSGNNLLGSTRLFKGEVFYLSKPRGVMITAPNTVCTSVKPIYK